MKNVNCKHINSIIAIGLILACDNKQVDNSRLLNDSSVVNLDQNINKSLGLFVSRWNQEVDNITKIINKNKSEPDFCVDFKILSGYYIDEFSFNSKSTDDLRRARNNDDLHCYRLQFRNTEMFQHGAIILDHDTVSEVFVNFKGIRLTAEQAIMVSNAILGKNDLLFDEVVSKNVSAFALGRTAFFSAVIAKFSDDSIVNWGNKIKFDEYGSCTVDDVNGKIKFDSRMSTIRLTIK